MDSWIVEPLLLTLLTPDLLRLLMPDLFRSFSNFSVDAPALAADCREVAFGSSFAPYFFSKSLSLISGSGFAALQLSLLRCLRRLPRKRRVLLRQGRL